MITAEQAKLLARFPAEIDRISNAIEEAASLGECGIWFPISEPATRELIKQGYEITTDKKHHPGKQWIWWGN